MGVGGIYGCGCKEVHVYRLPHTTYPYSSCICSFLQQHPYFLFILNICDRICITGHRPQTEIFHYTHDISARTAKI